MRVARTLLLYRFTRRAPRHGTTVCRATLRRACPHGRSARTRKLGCHDARVWSAGGTRIARAPAVPRRSPSSRRRPDNSASGGLADRGLGSAVASAKALPDAALPGNEWLWVGVGCGISLAGIALRVWAIRTLGTHFTRYLQVADDQRLVVDGPYRRLRHPSYAGAICMFTGVGIGLGNAVSVAALALLPAIGYIERIPREEALLVEGFGESYAEYARHTRRLVPGLW
jgi:protein-S-isoprenylcysteine O-methyltransferase Ste14